MSSKKGPKQPRRSSMVQYMKDKRSEYFVQQEVDILKDYKDYNSQQLHVSDHDESAFAAVSKLLEDDDETIPPIFAELMVLSHEESEGVIWKEHARWVKYEETVEEQGTRFSKPHITLVSIQSLLQLKNCLKHGSPAILDINVNNFNELMDMVVKNWVNHHAVLDMDSEATKSVLTSGKMHLISGKQVIVKPGTVRKSRDTTENDDEQSITMESPPSDTLQTSKSKTFLRKIPPGSEAAVIFVGQLSHIINPISVLVRLKPAHNFYPDVPEVEIPTRFVFFLLTPKQGRTNEETLKIGRAMGSLMTDEVFARVAYKARDQVILAEAVDEFLSQTLIVPPGKWDADARWEPSGEAQNVTNVQYETNKDVPLCVYTHIHACNTHITSVYYADKIGLVIPLLTVKVSTKWYIFKIRPPLDHVSVRIDLCGSGIIYVLGKYTLIMW